MTQSIPVIGLGGSRTGVDAAEFLIAGASAVQVGTMNFADPRAPLRIASELDEFMAGERLASVTDLVGSLQMKHEEDHLHPECAASDRPVLPGRSS